MTNLYISVLDKLYPLLKCEEDRQTVIDLDNEERRRIEKELK